jgi:opacity protein-like surface antigen
MDKLFLIISLVFLLGNSSPLVAQTQFKETKRFNDGFYFNVGGIQSNFLNSQFSQFREDGLINPKIGFAAGIQYVTYPLMFDVSYFNAPFQIEDYNWNYEDETRVRHQAIEAGLNLALLPNLKKLQPFVGAAFHSSQLGVGLSEDDEEEEASVNTSGFLFKTGLIFNFTSSFGLRAEYRRSLTTAYENADFNQLGVSILIRPSVTVY